MKPIDQTVFGVGKGNCFSACVATILELDLDSVPNFSALYTDETWYLEFVKWLAPRGLAPLTQQFPGDPDSFMSWVRTCAPKVPWIAGGPTDRGMHCCVYLGDQLLHDPNSMHGRKGLDEVEMATFILCTSFSVTGIDWSEDFYGDLANAFQCTRIEAKNRWALTLYSNPKFYGAQNAGDEAQVRK